MFDVFISWQDWNLSTNTTVVLLEEMRYRALVMLNMIKYSIWKNLNVAIYLTYNLLYHLKHPPLKMHCCTPDIEGRLFVSIMVSSKTAALLFDRLPGEMVPCIWNFSLWIISLFILLKDISWRNVGLYVLYLRNFINNCYCSALSFGWMITSTVFWETKLSTVDVKCTLECLPFNVPRAPKKKEVRWYSRVVQMALQHKIQQQVKSSTQSPASQKERERY